MYRHTIFALLLSVGGAHSRCLPVSNNSFQGEGKQLKLDQNGWLGHAVSTQTAALLLREVMGFEVTVVESAMDWGGENPSPLERIESSVVDANMEGWKVDWPAAEVNDFANVRETVRLSEHEFQGRIGIYVPRFVVNEHPDLFADYWRAYQTSEVIELFRNDNLTWLAEARSKWAPNCDSETFGCAPGEGEWEPPHCSKDDSGRSNCIPLYHWFPDYGIGWVEQLVTNLNLNISVYYAGEEPPAVVAEQGATGLPAMFYLWRPHEFLATDEYVRVTFPESNQACQERDTADRFGGRDCDQDGEAVYKVYRTTLEDYSKAAVEFFESYQLRLEDQNYMLRTAEAGGHGGTLTMEEAACEWAKENEEVWMRWIPSFELPACDDVLESEIERYPLSYQPLLRECFNQEDFKPCAETGCGKYATCPEDGVLCECTSSDTQRREDFATSRACEPTVASTDQQRVFWTLSMFLFSIGFVLTIIVINEFVWNPVLNDSVMRMFLGITVPDLVLSGVYFFFHFINLLNGKEMESGPCDFFAFVTTGVVYATFFGPPIVALATLYMFLMAIKGYPSWKPSKLITVLLCIVPWIFGIVIAIIVQAEGRLGSYRGLFCYNSDWDSFVTGGLTTLVFFLATFVTAAAYVATAWIAFNAGKQSSKKVATLNGLSVLRRGGALVATFFCTWAMFIIAVIMNMTSDPPPLTFEMVASLGISVQPIVDAFVLLSTPVVRREMFSRLNKKYGDGTTSSSVAGGSSSSSSSSYGTSCCTSSCQPASAAAANASRQTAASNPNGSANLAKMSIA